RGSATCAARRGVDHAGRRQAREPCPASRHRALRHQAGGRASLRPPHGGDDGGRGGACACGDPAVSDARITAKVLIVDADPTKLQALKAALTTAAYHVTSATSASF